jgi:MFS family permease
VSPIPIRGDPRTFLGLNRPPDQALTPAQVESNIRHLVGDIAWFGVVFGSIVAFLQVYLVRLGASSLLVGAITYGPALVGILWQIPAGRIMTRFGYRMRWVIASGLVYRSFFLAVVLVPFFFPNAIAPVTAGIWILSSFASSVSNVVFLSMMADAVPPDRRTQMVGYRLAAFGLANTLTTLIAGPLLQRIPFPTNYQVLFLIGFLGSLMSAWHVKNLHCPDPPAEHGQQPPILREVRDMLRFPGYARFVSAVFMLQLTLGMVSPLLPLYWVRVLGAADNQVSLVLSTVSGSLVVGSLLMRRAVARIGRERALAMGALGYALYPLLTSLSPSVWWLIPWAALAGLFNAGISVNLFDNLVSVTPESNRTNYMSLYNTAANAALFAGPVIAGVLANSAGGPTFGLRVAAGVGIFAGILLAARQPRPLVRVIH